MSKESHTYRRKLRNDAVDEINEHGNTQSPYRTSSQWLNGEMLLREITNKELTDRLAVLGWTIRPNYISMMRCAKSAVPPDRVAILCDAMKMTRIEKKQAMIEFMKAILPADMSRLLEAVEADADRWRNHKMLLLLKSGGVMKPGRAAAASA